MTIKTLQAFFEDNHLTYQTFAYLIEEAKELERLKLDIHRLTGHGAVECHIRILEAERFLTLLSTAADTSCR